MELNACRGCYRIIGHIKGTHLSLFHQGYMISSFKIQLEFFLFRCFSCSFNQFIILHISHEMCQIDAWSGQCDSIESKMYFYISLIIRRWRHEMEALSTLLALCEGNPPVPDRFPSQKASDVERWCFCWWQSEQTAEQTVERQVN